ncbi:MAG TPA: DoxX family membrane protein [Thermoanaerobaculia bacterium]|nr:DoxX family membrane protein [Thermoanaerobaculia bacterium]
MRIIYGLGRAVFGGFFLYNGINHLKNMKALEGYAAAKQLADPHLAVEGSGLLLLASGASLALGLKPRLGALGAIGFLTGACLLFHDFWNIEDPQQKQAETIQFSKNIGLLAAAVAFLGD